ncbi:MAG: helix-turn-helix domain-containing protein [Luteitalea sp.]|nr:helix-turn-helix domain-containing protein [Luteitalea sp.]
MHSGPEQFKDWLRRRGFNQADAARYLEYDQPFISQLLSGARSPGLKNAIHLERLTGIPVEAWTANDLDESAVTMPRDSRTRAS